MACHKGVYSHQPYCCCRPTPLCLFGGDFPYFELTGHPVQVSSLEFKCPDCFIWNCSYIVYPSNMKEPFRDNCLRYFYLCLAFLMAGCVEGIRRALVLGLVLIAGSTIEQTPSVGPLPTLFNIYTDDQPIHDGTRRFIYPDDLCITAQYQSFKQVEETIEEALET